MSKVNRDSLLKLYEKQFKESLNTLRHSHQKLKNADIPVGQSSRDLDDLEAWEALTARFTRTTDIYLSKYIRLRVLDLDPGFRGEMRDFLDKAEKNKIISSADNWMKVRELRNQIAHEYTKENLMEIFAEIFKWTDFVVEELKGY